MKTFNSFYYSFSREKNISEEAKYNDNLPIHVGLDFNVGYMTASFSHKVFINGRFEQHFFDELLLQGDSNTQQMGVALLARYPNHKMIVSCDASGKNRSTTGVNSLLSDVAVLRSVGITNVRFKNQNTRLRNRQLLVNGLFDHGQIKVNPACKLLTRDYDSVEQSKVDYTKIKDSAGKLTHFSDGADYVLDFEYTLPGQYDKHSKISMEDR